MSAVTPAAASSVNRMFKEVHTTSCSARAARLAQRSDAMRPPAAHTTCASASSGRLSRRGSAAAVGLGMSGCGVTYGVS